MNDNARQRLYLACSMVIFGTIGVFVRYIPFPSGVIAFARAAIGTIFLYIWMRARHLSLDGDAIARNRMLLSASATVMAFNWILLFEAYRHTTVAVATLCYYLAPVFVIAVSPFVLGERLTVKKVVCVLAAMLGMVLVTGIPENGMPTASDARGSRYGIGAAALYAAVVLLNKRMKDIGPYDRTVSQLATSAVVICFYDAVAGQFTGLAIAPAAIAMTVLVGVVHTGVAYALYFGSLGALPAQTAAIMSYLDPVVAVLLSVLLLREKTTPLALLGAALVLGSTLLSELGEKPAAESE